MPRLAYTLIVSFFLCSCSGDKPEVSEEDFNRLTGAMTQLYVMQGYQTNLKKNDPNYEVYSKEIVLEQYGFSDSSYLALFQEVRANEELMTELYQELTNNLDSMAMDLKKEKNRYFEFPLPENLRLSDTASATE